MILRVSVIAVLHIFTAATSSREPLLSTTDSCSGVAIYQLAFSTFWSEERFPKQYPLWRPRAQWSPLVGRSHNASFVLFREVELATPGLQGLAEMGETGDELSRQTQGSGGVLDAFQTANIEQGEGREEVVVVVNEQHSRVSVVSKIVPSPDWFVGLDSFDLCVNGEWRESANLALRIYDAGTDKGFTFTAPNWEERPPVVISEITAQHPSHVANSFYYPELERLPIIASVTMRKMDHYAMSCPAVSKENDGNVTCPNTSGKDGDVLYVTTEDSYSTTDASLPDVEGVHLEADQGVETAVNAGNPLVTPARVRPTETETRRRFSSTKKPPSSTHQPDTPPKPSTTTATTTVTMKEEEEQRKEMAIRKRTSALYSTTPSRSVAVDAGDTDERDEYIMNTETPTHEPVDCELGWSEWGPCSVTCGYGSQVRFYTKIREAQNGGNKCPFVPVRNRNETQLCGSMRNCEWAHFSFSNWGGK